MRSHQFLYTILLFALLSPESIAQDDVDQAYLDYIQEGWDAVRESQYNDSLQNAYAQHFYTYFLDHKQTEAGKKAIESAITMWGNTGNADMMDQTKALLHADSEIWARLVNSLGNAYARDSTRDFSVIPDTLRAIKARITNQEAKSAILTSLIRYNQAKNNPEGIIELSQELVNLNTSDWYVEFGLGAIYEVNSLAIGQTAPSFTAKSYDGKKISLADHAGKYIILDFWATWCGPCMPEIPVIKSLREKYSDQDLAIIGIAVENNSEELASFLSEQQMNWAQIPQDEKWEDELLTLYNVSGIPSKYIIDPEGKIVAKNIRGEELSAKIEELINGQ